MNCPSCNSVLTMSDRNGVEIDYCPQCRGVWLDRGELDKIIERSVSFDARKENSTPYQSYEEQKRGRQSYDSDDDDRRVHDNRIDPRRNKRKSFLGDLFDFD